MTTALRKTLALLHGAVLALRERRLAEVKDRLVEAEQTLAHIPAAQPTQGTPHVQNDEG